MNNRRQHNSVIVLATLGVYLGLVLVGATPQVLAQAAMTKQFNVKDEIEVKDDLDKKPLGANEDIVKAADLYYHDLARFLVDLGKQRDYDNSGQSLSGFSIRQVTYSPCPSDDTSTFRNVSSSIDEQVKKAVDRATLVAQIHLDYLSDCIPYDGFKGRSSARKSGIEISLKKVGFKYQLSFDLGSSKRASSLFEKLGIAFENISSSETDTQNQVLTVLYKNTRLTTANNQVFIVTQLPRAGLDALLAKDAK